MDGNRKSNVSFFWRAFAPYHGQEKLLLMTVALRYKCNGVKCSQTGKIQFLVAVRGSKTCVLKLPNVTKSALGTGKFHHLCITGGKNSTQQIYLFFETNFYCNIIQYITIQLTAINNDFSTIQVERIASLCIKLIFNKYIAHYSLASKDYIISFITKRQ